MTDSSTERASFEELDGHELLKPVHKLRASERMRLATRLMGLIREGEDFNLADMDHIADFMEFLEDKGYITDLDGWAKFFDENGMEGAVTLITAYAGEAIGAKQ